VQTGHKYPGGGADSGSGEVVASITVQDLTPSRLVASNGSSKLVSTDAASWMTGTASQVTVTDDGDGTVTLSLPQDIATTSTPAFGGATLTHTGQRQLRIAYDGSTYFDFRVFSSGSLQITSSNNALVHAAVIFNRDAVATWAVTQQNAGASSALSFTLASAGSGDTLISLNRGATTWYIGVDASANDAFKLSQTSLGFTDMWVTTGTSTSFGGHVLAITDNTYDFGASGATRFRSLYWGTQALGPDGSSGAPTYGFASNPDTGLAITASTVLFYTDATEAFRVGPTSTIGVSIHSSLPLTWGGASADVALYRDDTNILAQRRTTNAQAFRVYNTYTSSVSYEHLRFEWSSNVCRIYTQAGASGGTVRALQVGTGNNNKWVFDTSGHLVTEGDNLQDIGASGATRPRSLFLGSHAYLGSSSGMPTAYMGTQLAIGGAASSGFSWSCGNALVDNRTYDVFCDSTPAMKWRLVNDAASAATNFMVIARSGTTPTSITFTGHLLLTADNTYDIGASGATRPRSIYWGTQAFAPDGTTGNCAYSFASDPDTGFIWTATGTIRYIADGGGGTEFGSVYLWIRSDSAIIYMGASTDTRIYRDAAGVVAIKNSTTAQEFRVYGTTTGPKYLSLSHNGTISIVTDSGGDGVRFGSTGGKVGFYGTNPIALQTGVAVDSAGIHAALVALGLITS
jgi:hypothetical protein